MMLPPRSRSRLEAPTIALELELDAVRAEIGRLKRASENPLAWLALGILAFALELESPLERLRRLWLIEALLEAALLWYAR